MNAANEVAVHGFLRGRLGFLDIVRVVEETLNLIPGQPVRALDDIHQVDAEARRVAEDLITTAR